MKSNKDLLKEIQQVKAALMEHQQVIGDKLYIRVPRKNNTFEALPIESKELRNYMTKHMIDNYGFVMSSATWETVKSYVLGNLSSEEFSGKKNRIAMKNGSIYYDLHNEYDEELKYVEVKDGDWAVKTGDTEIFLWNQFSKEQVIPDKENADYLLLKKYLNIRDEDMLLALVYIASCLIPDKQHPILNIEGEHGTGKSTISSIIKMLIAPVKGSSSLSNFSDGKDGLLMQLAQFYLSVFDNIEKLPSHLNQTFCQAVTGGTTYRRKFYSQDTLLSVELNSIVVINGITPSIRKEDLVSRTVFIETNSLSDYRETSKLMEEFRKDLPKIFGGVLNVVAKAIQIKEQVNMTNSYRMAEFAAIGYAIAEAIRAGLGNQFMEAMSRNEKRQLQEVKKNEPLITLFQNFLQIHHDGVCWPVEKVFEDIVRNDIYHTGLGTSAKDLPNAPNALSRRVNKLKSLFRKYDMNIEVGSVPSNNYHTLTIERISDDEEVPEQDDSIKQEIRKMREQIIRKPIKLK